VNVAYDGYQDWYWNLREGSYVKVATCAPGPSYGIEFLVFRGTNNFNSWVQDVYSATWLYDITYGPGPCNNPQGGNGYYELPISVDDTYYFVYATGYNSATINFTIQLTRIEYDVTSGYIAHCDADCTTSLMYQSFQFLILLAPVSAVDDGYSMNWTPSSRGSIYFTIFISIFLVCGFPCLVYACCLKFRESSTTYNPLTDLSDPTISTPTPTAPTTTPQYVPPLPPAYNPSAPPMNLTQQPVYMQPVAPGPVYVQPMGGYAQPMQPQPQPQPGYLPTLSPTYQAPPGYPQQQELQYN